MNFRKIIGIAALTLLLSVTAVSADGEPGISVGDGKICASLSGQIDVQSYFGFDELQMKNRAPYLPLQIAVVITDPESGKMLYTNQLQADDEGRYGTDFIMNVDSGVYNMRVYTAYGKIYDGTVEYSDGLTDSFNALAADENTAEMKNFMYSYGGYMNLDLSVMKEFSEGEQIKITELMAKKAPYAKKSDIGLELSEAQFSVGLASDTLHDEEKTKMFNSYMDLLGADFADISAFIKTNNLAAYVIDDFNSGKYTSLKDDIYLLALRAFTAHRVENIYDLEVLFKDNLFSVPDSVMKKYNAVKNKTAFYTELNKKVKNLESLQDFYDAAEECAKAADKKEDNKTTGGGGGGGGGRSNVPVISAPSAVVTPKPQEDKKDDTPNEPQKIEFSDLDSHEWAKTAIYALAEAGAVNGSGDGKFLPQNSIKREEFVKMLALSFKLGDKGADVSFNDVGENDWFKDSVRACVSNGIINGISDTEFGTGRYVTRQDAAAMLARMFNAPQPDDTEKFGDDAEIADYAKGGIYMLKAADMLGGYEDNTFRPNLPVTRAEAAKMIYNLLKKEV